MEIGSSQGPLLMPFMSSNFKSPIPRDLTDGMEGNITQIWEEGEFKEGPAEENNCVDMQRNEDNLYEQSSSPLFSVFGRPLLLGGSSNHEDLEPLRVVVAADGSEWGLECSGPMIEAGEELDEDGQRMEEAQNKTSVVSAYENWESSCLAKFSEFLGFPTKGFENESLELLRNLVATQHLVKEKGIMTMSECERELRRLESTINYNGKNMNKGGGRGRGNLLLKLNWRSKSYHGMLEV